MQSRPVRHRTGEESLTGLKVRDLHLPQPFGPAWVKLTFQADFIWGALILRGKPDNDLLIIRIKNPLARIF